MATSLTDQRLHNQHLVGVPLGRPQDVVAWLGAVQSQDYNGAKWALSQRAKQVTGAQIDKLFNDGKILRTHVMRPTWHFVSPNDIRWLLQLTAPRVHAGNAYYYRKFQLNADTLKKSESIIAKALKGNQLTRDELALHLKEAGITASGLRLGYIFMSAELNGLICSGALKGKQHTYALLDERVPHAKPLLRDKALAELAKRYFTSHGPAQLQDFTWWSGLSVADAKAGIEAAHLKQLTQDGKTYWYGQAANAAPAKGLVHLLPNYDEYLIAYKDRSAFAATFVKTPPAGIFDGHILVVNGKVAGAWRVTQKGKTTTLGVTPLVALGKAETAALHAAVANYGKFIDAKVELLT